MTVNILMVCLGNICRSPLAEALLAHKLPRNNYFVDSAGTGNWHVGKKPDSRSIAIAKKYGLDISHQKARQFSIKDFDDFDYIFAMDNDNFNNIIKLAKNDAQKVKVNLILNELYANENMDVPDPYYGMTNGFETVYRLLDEATMHLAQKLSNKYQR